MLKVYGLLLLLGHVMAVQKSTLTTLLFYTCVTPQIGNQCEEGYTMDQSGIATHGFSSNFTTIALGEKNNITTLFAVHDTFFENGAGLRKDWKDAWASLQLQLVPYIESKTIVGFMVGDELFPGKISLSDFTVALKALQKMKMNYPWLITWENEGGRTWVNDFQKDGIPIELDVISFDDYYMWLNATDTPQSQVQGHRDFYDTKIYPLLHPHQSVYIVPGSFATQDPRPPSSPGYPHGNKTYCYNGTANGCDVYMAEQADAYASWAFEDPRVTGIGVWHWDSRQIGVVTPYKEVGVVDMPKTRDAWQAIGNKIREQDAGQFTTNI